MVFSTLGLHQILRNKRRLWIASFAKKHGRNTCGKETKLNVWNIALETKYKISLEDGKEDMSITCKSRASKLPYHKSIVAKSCFSGFHLWTWIHEKKMTPIIQAYSDLWNLQNFEPQHSQG